MVIQIGGKNYIIIQNLSNPFSSNLCSLVKEKGNDNNNTYILTTIKNLSEEQINLLKQQINSISTLREYFEFNFNSITLEKDDNDNYFILEKMSEEKNLRTYIDEYKQSNKNIEEKVIYNIMCQICLYLKVIHGQNIIHFNLKPENILINEENEITICNFDFSKNLGIKNKISNKFYLMSPEIIKNENYSNKVDIWCFGFIIFELFNLNYYFEADNIKDLLDKILN